jgi:hypothetical protein
MSAVYAQSLTGVRRVENGLVREFSIIRWVTAYAFSLLTSTLGVWFVAGSFGAIVLKPILGSETVAALELKPYYPLFIIFGVLIGYVCKSRWAHLCTPWVWVMPLVYLIMGMASWLWAGSGVSAVGEHFLGRYCSPFCRDQYQRTVPVFSTIAFSLGVLGHRLRSLS